MAVLAEADRVALWADYMRRMSSRQEAMALSKVQLRAAVDATDQWIEDNAGAFDTALPVTARTNLTARQKAQLFSFVADKRFGVL